MYVCSIVMNGDDDTHHTTSPPTPVRRRTGSRSIRLQHVGRVRDPCGDRSLCVFCVFVTEMLAQCLKYHGHASDVESTVNNASCAVRSRQPHSLDR
jgi:hypothetical protein